MLGTTQTFSKVESALAHLYQATPGLKLVLGKAHDKLLAFGYGLEKTTAGQALTKVGQGVEGVLASTASAGRRALVVFA